MADQPQKKKVRCSKGRMFEAHHDPCLLLEGEATLPAQKITKKIHVVLKQGHNNGSP